MQERHPCPARSMRRRNLLLAAGGCAFVPAWAQVSPAPEFPARPITLIVPHPPGSFADLLARTLGQELAPLLRQPVIVENRPGASQVVASRYVARQKPDGHVLMISLTPNVIAPELRGSLNFRGNTDFEAVAYLASLFSVLAVSPDLPVASLQEFIALLKAHPGQYRYGSVGVGTALHMNLEMFNRAAGTRSVHVPYKVFGNIVTDVASNQVQYSFLPFSATQLAAQGKVKILGSNGLTRDPDHPHIQTLQEQGMKGFEAAIKYFIVAPRGTPAPIVDQLNAAINGAIGTPAFAEKFKALGGVAVSRGMTPAQAWDMLAHEDRRFIDLVREQGIALQ